MRLAAALALFTLMTVSCGTPAYAISITQVAAGTTILVNVIEAPATWRKSKAAIKKIFHRKPKQTPVDCLTGQPAGTPCPIERKK